MRANQLMDTDLRVVSVDATLEQAARYFSRCELNTLPVVDKGHHLVGSISRLDILKALKNRLTDNNEIEGNELVLLLSNNWRTSCWPADELLVGEVMSAKATAANEHTPDIVLCALMVENQVDTIPIVRHERVIGQVSASDILRQILDSPTDRDTDW